MVWAAKLKRKEAIMMCKRIFYRPAILLMAFALIFLAGVSTVAYAQSNSTQLEDGRGIFNPFTLNTIIVVRESNANVVIAGEGERPPIRIPVRPALRSYFRPPLVPLVASTR